MKLNKIISSLLLFPLFLHGCSQPESPGACTDEFVTHSVTVHNQNGEPADSVNIQVTNEIGTSFDCDEYLCQETLVGTYIVMHDGLKERISDSKETFIVVGMKDELQFNEDFVFRSGECHVEKIAGPDTVSLTSN